MSAMLLNVTKLSGIQQSVIPLSAIRKSVIRSKGILQIWFQIVICLSSVFLFSAILLNVAAPESLPLMPLRSSPTGGFSSVRVGMGTEGPRTSWVKNICPTDISSTLTAQRWLKHQWIDCWLSNCNIWSCTNYLVYFETNSYEWWQNTDFFSLVNYSFNTGNIHSKIGQIVTDFWWILSTSKE